MARFVKDIVIHLHQQGTPCIATCVPVDIQLLTPGPAHYRRSYNEWLTEFGWRG